MNEEIKGLQESSNHFLLNAVPISNFNYVIQPERSKREDRLETALNLNHEIVKAQLSSGCGALNIVETQ